MADPSLSTAKSLSLPHHPPRRLRLCLLTPKEKAERAAPIDLASLDSSPPNRYLIASMGLQLLWSFGLACLDAYALKKRRDLQNPILVSLFVVGDWVTAMLTLPAACSSAGLIVLFAKDLNYCNQSQLPCGRFEISVVLAFIAWILIAISSQFYIHETRRHDIFSVVYKYWFSLPYAFFSGFGSFLLYTSDFCTLNDKIQACIYTIDATGLLVGFCILLSQTVIIHILKRFAVPLRKYINSKW